VADPEDHIFLFVQAELPWELGLPDGRYLLRSGATRKPEQVIVLAKFGIRRGDRGLGRWRRRERRRESPPDSEPEPVVTTRATIVDAVPVAIERQAKAWLADIDAERDVQTAFAALNRLLRARRIAAADPYVREASPAHALTIRAGWGEGDQLSMGRWTHAEELPWAKTELKLRRRGVALRPDERLAQLLAARDEPLICEELALRARLDLDQDRLALATIELDRALRAALVELAGDQRADLPLRVSELESLQAGVVAAARATLDSGTAQDVAEDTVRHALERLEAALRARSAAGEREA
jgi:hypothetical protein